MKLEKIINKIIAPALLAGSLFFAADAKADEFTDQSGVNFPITKYGYTIGGKYDGFGSEQGRYNLIKTMHELKLSLIHI